jgi:ZIP family zinc transporter
MPELVALALAGTGTAIATGLGAIPVFALGSRAVALRPLLWGLAAGLMGVASIVGLLLPALDEGSNASVAGGFVLGVAFLAATRRLLAGRDVHFGRLSGAGVRRSALVFTVLLVHSLPEGFAIGTAFASEREGLGLYIVLAIALQNIPEGTASAIPMHDAGFSRGAQFWGAVATSLPQPVGAVVAFVLVEQISGLLAASFAFAAGAMCALIVVELVPQAFTARTWRPATVGVVTGAGLMLVLSALLGV